MGCAQNVFPRFVISDQVYVKLHEAMCYLCNNWVVRAYCHLFHFTSHHEYTFLYCHLWIGIIVLHFIETECYIIIMGRHKKKEKRK